MSIGGISSSSYTQLSSSSDANSGNDPIGQLLKAIRSGNLKTAQAAYQNVLDHAPGGTSDSSGSSSSSTSASSSSNPLQQLISQLGTALQSGDITTAQSLVKSFEANKPSGDQPPPPPNGGPNSAVGQAVGSLLSSVQSGDLSSAQQAYSSLESLLEGSSASSTSSTSSTSTSSSGNNPLAQLIQSLGTSLEAGDIDGAQSTLAEFSQNAPNGLAVNATA